MNRHERRRAAANARKVEVPASARIRVMKFIEAFHNAPNDADLDLRIGASEAGEAALMISISGGGDHCLMVDEARKVAEIMEESMNAHPDDPEAATLPNIIMMLRTGCDRTERECD